MIRVIILVMGRSGTSGAWCYHFGNGEICYVRDIATQYQILRQIFPRAIDRSAVHNRCTFQRAKKQHENVQDFLFYEILAAGFLFVSALTQESSEVNEMECLA